jgi:hypothetical protein
MKYVGGTFLGPKMMICANLVVILGFECSYKGRRPKGETIEKILNWGDCKSLTDI